MGPDPRLFVYIAMISVRCEIIMNRSMRLKAVTVC